MTSRRIDIDQWLVVPVARAYLRYFPFSLGKRQLWTRVLEPSRLWELRRFVARTRFGARIAGTTSELVEQRVYFFGVWEPNLTAWIVGRLAPGDTFVDVGANIGYFTLLASSLVGPTGAVVAVEASPATFEQLVANVQRNGCTNVRTINVAAGDRDDQVTMYRGPAFDIGKSSLFPESTFTAECQVPMRRISDMLTASEAAHARIVKIDVEGAEALVVDGLEPLLRAGRSDLEVVIEINPGRLESQGRRVAEIFDVFGRAGFTGFAIENDYDVASYVKRRPSGPARLQGSDFEGDVIFSRGSV